MMQPFETDTNGAGMPTGRTVIAFGRLLELDRAARAAALAKLSEDDPDLARQLASLLANADRPTIVITGFAATTSTGPAPHPHLVAGSRIGGFELLEQIGSGGMGEVWRARQSNPTREVALKVARLDAHAATRSAAVREPEALAALRHPGIATIHASGIDGGFGWIAMELIDGAQTLVDAARTQPLRTRIALLADVADAIAHAHAAGFIHRDLKPSNILVDAAGRVKVIDFGIALPSADARIADPVAWCGTPAYLAPEALDHDPSLVDARADIYALGVILYELAFGALPAGLSQRDPIALLRALATVSFAPPADAARETRGDLAAIIAKATARDPEQRYRTVAALSDDLRALLAHRPVAAAPPNAAARLRLAVRRNPVAAALVIAVFLCLIAATAVSTYYALYARRAAIEAGALATKTGEVYGSFLQIFLPDDIAKPEVRSLSVEEYLRSRVQNLERMAAAAMPLDQLDGKLQIPQTLQYACLSLGLVTEAERCAIARELIESRINDPKGAIAGMRNLDSLYARLARDPNNQAARSALDTLIPTLLSQYAIVRAEPLSVIAAVDYYGNPTMSAHVAELLVRQEPDSPEVLMAALSRLVIAAHKSTQQGEILNDQHLANLRNCVQILRRLAASSDPMVRRQTRSIASRANMLLSADLPVARNPELSPILIELALIEHELDEFKSRLTRHCVTLHYFQVTPFRLAQAGEWDACTKSLETLDEVVRSKHLTLDHSDIRNFALARAELALHRNADINPSAGRLKALEILGDALSTDVAAEDPYTAYTSFAAAIDRHATLAAELGFREELTRDLERTDRFLRSINNSRAPADLVLQVGERIAILLRATPQPIRE